MTDTDVASTQPDASGMQGRATFARVAGWSSTSCMVITIVTPILQFRKLGPKEAEQHLTWPPSSQREECKLAGSLSWLQQEVGGHHPKPPTSSSGYFSTTSVTFEKFRGQCNSLE